MCSNPSGYTWELTHTWKCIRLLRDYSFANIVQKLHFSILWLPLTRDLWICVLAISQLLRLVSYLRLHNNIHWVLPNPGKIFHILVYTTVHIWLLSFLRTHNNTVHRLHVSHVVLSDCSHISWEPAPTTLLNYLVTLVCSTSKAISWERTPLWCLPYLGNC